MSKTNTLASNVGLLFLAPPQHEGGVYPSALAPELDKPPMVGNVKYFAHFES